MPAAGFARRKPSCKRRERPIWQMPPRIQRGVGELIAALREVGPQLGNYPSAEIIELEVTYNHWALFRIAWVCTLLALLGALLSWTSRWRPFYWAA